LFFAAFVTCILSGPVLVKIRLEQEDWEKKWIHFLLLVV